MVNDSANASVSGTALRPFDFNPERAGRADRAPYETTFIAVGCWLAISKNF
jgi:hypothetical protein